MEAMSLKRLPYGARTNMSRRTPSPEPSSREILRKILPASQLRRFERVTRITKCVDIASDLKARHTYLADDDMAAQLEELLQLLIKEKGAAQMEHFHASDAAMAVNAGRPLEKPQAPRRIAGMLHSLASLLKRGG